jgi:hypothetical protein
MNRLMAVAAAAFALTAAAPPAAGPVDGIVASPSPEDVLNWTVSDPQTVYVEDSNGQWHRLTLAAPCDALRNAYGVELQGSPDHRFGHASVLATGGSGCVISSMSIVSEPPIPPQQPFAASAVPGPR